MSGEGEKSVKGKIGPGRPPVHSRFQKGKSGNPAGRPKRSKSLRKLIEEELEELIAVTEGGKRIKLPKRQVLAKTLVNDAIKGDRKAQTMLLPLIGGHHDNGEEMISVDPAELARFLQRHLPKDEGEG